MKFTQLTQHQKEIIAQSYHGKKLEDIDLVLGESLQQLSHHDLWSHFLNMEADPEEVEALYQTLFGIPKSLEKIRECACVEPPSLAWITLGAIVSTYGHRGDPVLKRIATLLNDGPTAIGEIRYGLSKTE